MDAAVVVARGSCGQDDAHGFLWVNLCDLGGHVRWRVVEQVPTRVGLELVGRERDTLGVDFPAQVLDGGLVAQDVAQGHVGTPNPVKGTEQDPGSVFGV